MLLFVEDVFRRIRSLFAFLILFQLAFIEFTSAGDAVSLNNDNYQQILGRNEIVFLNFYADWCRFSQILAPTFDEASRKVSEEFPEAGRVMFAKVDCDREVNIASQYRISKYPTLKLFRNGQMVKKEYRGQRSVEAMVNFIQEELKDPVEEHQNLDSIDELDPKKRYIIGYFEDKASDNYRTFAKVAGLLRDDCKLHAAFGPVSASERAGGDTVVFRPPNTRRQDITYMGSLNNLDQLYKWASENCVPLVREITFENAEELTEEGLPFLILFRDPEDTATEEIYNREVANQLLDEKNNVNFLVADGNKFTHPLHHLGKSAADLPVLAIDSFRHMYLFPHNCKTDLGKPGLLKQFIQDLHSGKLHREFHHGPDPTTMLVPTPTPDSSDGHVPIDNTDNVVQQHQQQQQQQQQRLTQPPESIFKKLQPSRNRYTILRDEL